jgi:hypothetical protein
MALPFPPSSTAEGRYVSNLRRRATGRLDSHNWARPSRPTEPPLPPPPPPPPEGEPSEEDEAAKAVKAAAKEAAKEEERYWAGMDLPPIRLSTRELLLRPPEPEWSISGLLIAVSNILCAPAPAMARISARDGPHRAIAIVSVVIERWRGG